MEIIILKIHSFLNRHLTRILLVPVIALMLILLMALLSSCFDTKNAHIQATEFEINGVTLDVYTIDSCEYIGNIYKGSGQWATHKGNCKFCANRNKKK